MSIVSPDKYGFDFAELDSIAQPYADLVGKLDGLALAPTELERQTFDDLNQVFAQMAMRGGVRAAMRRLFPQEGSSLPKSRNNDGSIVATQTRKLPGLVLQRFATAGSGDSFFAYLDNPDKSPVLAIADQPDVPVYFIPGPWLKTLQDEASKAPMHRHESPAAFQLWLKANSPKA